MTKIIHTEIGFEIVDLPALVGTEKQIAWASDIRAGRARFVRHDLSNFWGKAVEKGIALEQFLAAANASGRFTSEFDETSAATWISHRG